MNAIVRRNGDEFTLALPASMGERLGLKEGEEFALTELEDGMKFSRQARDLARQLSLVDTVLDRHDQALRRLANR